MTIKGTSKLPFQIQSWLILIHRRTACMISKLYEINLQHIVHSLIHTFIHSWISSFICSIVDSFFPSDSCIHAFMHSCVHSFIRSFVHSVSYYLAKIPCSRMAFWLKRVSVSTPPCSRGRYTLKRITEASHIEELAERK